MSKMSQPPQMEAYAKKKRRKKIAWIVLSVGFVGTASLGIIAFIGQYSGHFTVSLVSRDVSLSLSTNESISDPTTNLRSIGLPGTYPTAADALPTDSQVDSNEGGSKNSKFYDGLEHGSDQYFAYTFFAENAGVNDVPYHLVMQIDDNKLSYVSGAVNLLYIIRLRIFENAMVNGQDDTHSQTTYAFRDSATNDGRAIISPGSNKEENLKSAEIFASDSVVFNLPRTFYTKTKMRFTVVAWLEGWDPDCSSSEPLGASLTFSLHLNADDSSTSSSSSSSSSAGDNSSSS